MSWTDKELSEMAKAAQAEQKFAYQDSFWTEMEAMLPAKKKKVLPFFWLALIPVVATIGYLAYPSTHNDLMANEAVKTFENGFQSQIGLSGHALAANNIKQVNRSSQAGVAVKQQSYSITNSKANAASTALSNKKEISTINKSTDSNKALAKSQIMNDKPISIDNGVSEIDNGQSSSLKTRLTVFKAEPLDLIPAKAEPIVQVNTPIVQNKERKISAWPIGGLQPLRVSTFAFAAKPEFLPLTSRLKRNFWNAYAEAGFSMGQSYMTSQVGHTTAFNLGAGARYDFNNYFVQFGLAGELQKVKYELSDRSVIYGFDKTELENRFTYNQLYRVEAPLSIGYQFPKHLFQLSVIPAYLVGTKMDYSHLMNGSLVSNETMYEMEPGKKEAWNDFSTSFGLGYGYRLTKTISLGANVKWQLINQLNNKNATEGNVRPLSGQVFIRKTLK